MVKKKRKRQVVVTDVIKLFQEVETNIVILLEQYSFAWAWSLHWCDNFSTTVIKLFKIKHWNSLSTGELFPFIS